MTDIKRYLVGGAVRDRLLGVKSKDLDYVVLADSFDAMRDWLLSQDYEIFVDKPDLNIITARATDHTVADFVLAREEGPYSDHRHPDWTKPGTLKDDLERRDFTVNALAEADDGTIIDLFGGVEDLENKILRAVGWADDRLREDPLRVFRALRFAVTKDFRIEERLDYALRFAGVTLDFSNTSSERVRDELHKMFRHDSRKSMSLLCNRYPRLIPVIMDKGIWFEPTLKDA